MSKRKIIWSDHQDVLDQRDEMLKALKVIAWDRRTRAWLKENDPKALEQVETSIKKTGDTPPGGWDDLDTPVEPEQKCFFSTGIDGGLTCCKTGEFDDNGYPEHECSAYPCIKFRKSILCEKIYQHQSILKDLNSDLEDLNR